MKKVLLFGLIGFSTLLISCSSSKTPEEVAINFYESFFSGDYGKAFSFIRDRDGSQLDKFKKEEFIKRGSEIIENLKKRHGMLKSIKVKWFGQISVGGNGIRLDVEFEDGYIHDVRFALKKFNGDWKIYRKNNQKIKL